YLKYRNVRPDYVTAWRNVANWDQAAENFAAAGEAEFHRGARGKRRARSRRGGWSAAIMTSGAALALRRGESYSFISLSSLSGIRHAPNVAPRRFDGCCGGVERRPSCRSEPGRGEARA